MDTRYEIPPRLRLNRQASSFAATVDDSNFHNTFIYERERDASDGGDDDGSTPRLGVSKMSVDSFDEPLHFSAQAQAQSTPAPAREATPAERLRALLSRANSLTPTARTQNAPLEKTPTANAAGLRESDMESDDFETPRPPANGVPATPLSQQSISSSVTQSVARESLRNIVAHAMRSPGNTPGRRRRPRTGSMDSSIVEESPIKWPLLKPGERVKRLSLSDDEKERLKAARPSSNDERSIESFTSSQAVIYDQLRQRLEGPQVDTDANKGKSVAKSDMTIDMEEATEVEEQLLNDHGVPLKSSTPPVPSNTSLAQQSTSQFPSHFLGSNLLTQNSDMQRMIEEVQTETTDSEAPESNRKNDKTPAAGPSSARIPSVRPRTLSRNGSIGSIDSSSSRPMSRQSMNELDDVDQKRERERGWNHPLGPYMERHRAASPIYSVTQSGGFARMRNVSLGSISGSESDVGRLSPMSAKQQNNQQPMSKYAGIASNRFSSSSPNQVRTSTRIRTVSQPAKPSSPGSLASSTKSDRTRRPLDRSRAVSLTARDPSWPSSSHAHARLPPEHRQNGIHNMEDSNRSVSPSSSRPSSRASSRASFSQPESPEQIHTRERNWNSPRPKWNAIEPPSLLSGRRRTGSTAQTKTPAADQGSPVRALHATSSSPSGIPKLSVNGRSRPAKHADADNGGEVRDRKARNSPVSTNSTNPLANGKRASSSKNREIRQPNASKRDHEALSRSGHERDHGRPRPESPTPSGGINGSEESEDDTPKLGQQRILDSPTRGSGSRPSSRAGFSLHSVRTGNDHGNRTATVPASITDKEWRLGEPEQSTNTQPTRVGVPSEPIDLHDSDLDSFQEEDIIASSSAPRLPNGNDSYDENYVASQDGRSHGEVDVLRPGQDLRLSGHEEGSHGKRSSLPANFSPPLSPPPDPVTSTPQRRGSANTSKMKLRTPSPPKGMPALPDPPSSDEEVASDKTPPAPVTPVSKSRHADAKTPKFPGAWGTPFATPAPALATRMSTLPKMSDPEERHFFTQDETHARPASYPPATSIVTKTPAPPGAWLPTPGTIAAKRLQQKVRFDEHGPSAASAPVPTVDDGTLSSDISAVDGSVSMKAVGKVKPVSPRTPGRIRVVDAFGNEILPTKSGDGKRATQKVDELHATGKDEKSNASESRKARIRVLDAMGREIDESQVRGAGPVSISDESAKQSRQVGVESIPSSVQELVGRQLERKQALQLLQKTIAELKDDFNKTDDLANAQTTDAIDAQIADLKAQSIRAREDRERLLQKIRNARMGNPPSRLLAAWNALFKGKNAIGASTRSTHFKVLIVLMLLQVVMFFAFYRLTSLGARQLFLTTYIDPFYPELYIQVTNPDNLELSMTPNAYSEPHTSSPPSWIGSILSSLYAILARISTLKENVWDIWRDPPRSMPWPPT